MHNSSRPVFLTFCFKSLWRGRISLGVMVSKMFLAIVGLRKKNKRPTHFTLPDNRSLSFFSPPRHLSSLHLQLSVPDSAAAIRVNMHNWSSLFAQVPTPHNRRIMEEHFRHRCSLFITLLSVTLSQNKGRESSVRSCSPAETAAGALHHIQAEQMFHFWRFHFKLERFKEAFA